MNSSEKNYHCN